MRALTVTMLVLMLAVAAAGAGEGEHHAPVKIDDPRFDFLRQLEGTWTGQPAEGQPGGVFEFRLTAGGTAIEEREFAGSPMEMVTLYHLDGADLVADHYCMLGNQPRLTASRAVVNDTLTFTCDGKPRNTASHDAEHVHSWTMRLDGQGRLVYSVEIVKAGKVTESPSLVMTRSEASARR